MKPIQKAAASHKIGLVESRLTYWREFHRKLRREQRNAIAAVQAKFQLNEQMVELELLSGGNIRFEEISLDSEGTESDYMALCEKLVQDNCSGKSFTLKLSISYTITTVSGYCASYHLVVHDSKSSFRSTKNSTWNRGNTDN